MSYVKWKLHATTFATELFRHLTAPFGLRGSLQYRSRETLVHIFNNQKSGRVRYTPRVRCLQIPLDMSSTVWSRVASKITTDSTSCLQTDPLVIQLQIQPKRKPQMNYTLNHQDSLPRLPELASHPNF